MKSINKIKFYLTHDHIREKIAKNGYLKCIKGNNTHRDKIDFIISFLLNIPGIDVNLAFKIACENKDLDFVAANLLHQYECLDANRVRFPTLFENM